MGLAIGLIIVGMLLVLWGLKEKSRSEENIGKTGTILDVLLNGFGSGIGMMLSGLVVIIIGIVLMFT